MKHLVARICGRCNEFVKGDAPCPKCDSGPRLKVEKQTIFVDGPTLMATNDPMFKVDPNDRDRRRIVPNRNAYREHVKSSKERLGFQIESVG